MNKVLLELIIERSDKETFLKYTLGLFCSIPSYIYQILILVFLFFFFTIVKELRNGLILISRLLLVEYLYLIVCSTIIFRKFSESKSLEFVLFWSYERAAKGEIYLFYENMMNIAVFIPIGILMCLVSPNMKWWRVVIVGFSISLSIEILQLCFRRGLFEIDDLVHNTVGCFLGVALFYTIKYLCLCFTNCCKSRCAKEIL